MIIKPTDVKDLLVLEPKVFGDERGYFFESFSAGLFEKEICYTQFIQDNESKSSYGVLRGLHYQLPPKAQSKLVRVVYGEVLDVAVDIRVGSPTFGKHHACRLSGDNKLQMFIPRGFAHGFVVLSKEAVFQYKCDNYYSPQDEGAIMWNDPTLAIDWILPEEDLTLSEKDKKHPLLKDAKLFDYNQNLYK